MQRNVGERLFLTARFLAAALLVEVVASITTIPSAQADVVYWDNFGGTANDWGSLANWSTVVEGGTDPSAIPGAADVATFSATPIVTTAQTVNLNADISVLGLDFTSAVTAATTLQGGGTGRTLTIGANGITKAGTGAVSIGSATAGQEVAIALAADQTWANSNNTGAITITNGVTSNAAGARILTLGGASTALNTISGIIGNGLGTVSLVKSGAGTWVLSGTNTYSGGTTLSAGTVAISNATSFGSGNVSVTGSSRINATGNLSYANAIDVGAALSLQNVTTTASTAVFSGVLSGSNAITVVNNGTNNINATLAFTNTGNTFTGNIILPSGNAVGNDIFSFNSIGDGGNFTFQKAGNRNAVAYTGTSDITFNTRQIALGAAFAGVLDGNNVPINAFQNNSSANTVTFNGNLSVGAIAAAGGTFFFDGSNTGANTFAGVIPAQTSGGALGIGKWGTGKWILTGANAFTGNVIVGQGTLSVNAISDNTNNQPLGKGSIQLGLVNQSGTLEFTGSTSTTDKQVRIGTTTAAQTGAGSILNNGSGSLTFTNATFNPTIASITATRTLTLGGSYAGGANAIQGIIQDNVASTGKVNLTVTGSAWTLSGVNTYTGVTTLSAGILRATTSASALGAGTLSLGGGELQLANDTGLAFNRNTTVTGNTAITSDRLAGGAGVTHTLGTLSIGAQTLTINRGANATNGTGGITFGAATLTGAATFSPQADSLLTFSSTTALGANTLTKSGAGAMTLTGVVSGSKAAGSNAISITGGVLTASGANTFTGNIAVAGSSSVFAMAGATYTTTAPYGAAGNLYKQLLLTNGGTFRLTSGSFNNNAPTTTNVAAGIIFNIGSGGGTLDVASGATLIIDDGTGTGTASTASQLQGSGTITKTGLGTLSQDDSTAFAGAIIVTAGSLQPATGNAFGAASAGTTIQSGARLNVNGITMTNQEPLTIYGTGLASAPAGALTSSTGTGTWVGPVTLGSNATISGGAGALTLSSTATVNLNGFTLTLGQGGARTTTSGVISGTGAVVVSPVGTGGGDWADSAAHIYSGNTTLNANTQTVPGLSSVGVAGVGAGVTSGPFGTGTLILNGGAMRNGTGNPFTVGNAVTLQADTLYYATSSEKNLTFAGPVTISGATRTLTSTVGTTVAGTTIVFDGAIGEASAGLGLTKDGAGNLQLRGANTYTGPTTVSAGQLSLTGSISSTALTVAGGSTLTLVSNAANAPAPLATMDLGTVATTTTLGLDLGANTAGSDSLAATGATTAGTVNFNLNAIAGFGTSSSYTLLSAGSGLSGATYTLVNIPGGYTFSLTPSDTAVTLTVTPAAATGNLYWGGGVNNSWGGLSAATTNWTTDAAGMINAGYAPAAGNTVFFSGAGAVGPAIALTIDGNYTVNDLQFTAAPAGVTSVSISVPADRLNTNPTTLTIAPAVATTGITLAQGAGAVTIGYPLTLGAPQTWSVDSSTPSTGTASSLTVSGAISGAAANGVTFTTTAGTTPIILAATGSTYSGPSTVSAATVVQGGATNGLSPNTTWTVDGTLNTGDFSQNTGSLAGGLGIVQNGSANGRTLTIGSDNLATATFAGTIQDGSTGTLGITKTGTGTQILAGTNTYTGTTAVNAGVLQLNSPIASTAVTVSGGTLRLGTAGVLPVATAMTFSGTGTLDLFGNSHTIASLATTGTTSAITNSSPSTAVSTATTTGTPSGAGVYVDALTITAAGQTIAPLITDGAIRKTQIITNNANATTFVGLTNGALNTFSGGLVLANNASGTRLQISAAISGTPFGAGPIIIGQTATDKAGIYFNAADNTLSLPLVVNTALGTDRYGIRNDGRTITLSGLIAANADAVFSSNSATASNTIITGQVTGAGGLVLDLSQTSTANTLHTVTLTTSANANDYAGDTIVGRTNAAPAQNYAATLTLGASDQIPSGFGKGNVILNNNTAARIGTLNLNGFNETINGLLGNGTVDGGSGTPTLTVGDNNATATFSGIIQNTAGALTLTKIGGGVQTLSGASTFAGPINVNGGLIAFPSSPATSGPLGNSTVVNLNGGGLSYTAVGANNLYRDLAIGAGNGTVDVASSTGMLVVNNTLTSAGGNLVKTGPGVLQLANTTTLNGGLAGVVVNGGTLEGGFGTAGIGSINIAAQGRLSLLNSTAETLNLTTGGGPGTLTLAGGAQLGFELGATGFSDQIVYNTASGTGTVSLNFFGLPSFTGASSFTLLTSSTVGGLAGFNFDLGSAPLGFNYTISNDGTTVGLVTTPYTPIYWRGGQDLSWNTLGAATANWTTDAAGTVDATSKPVSTDTVIFSASGTPMSGNTITTTLDAAFTVDSLQFTGVPAGVSSVTIAAGTGGTLTLKPASASGGIAIITGGGNAFISAPLTLDNTPSASQTWSVADAGSTLTISGNVVFGANVRKTGAGSLELSGANSGAGTLTLSAGTLVINSAGALGSGALNISAGTTLNNTSGVAITTTANNPININGDFTFAGSNDLNLGTGAVTLTNNPTLNAAGTLTLGGAVGGGSGLVKQGSGTLILAGANTYSGTTTVAAGALNLLGNNTTSGQVVLAGGTLNLGHAGALGSGTLVVNNGTIDNLAGSALVNANNNVITFNGPLTFTGTNDLNLGTGAVTLAVPTNITVSTSGKNLTLGGAIGGSFGLTKSGPGTLTLAGANTYGGPTGPTSITDGTLALTGSLSGTNVTVSGSGALNESVTGTISGGTFSHTTSGTSTLAGANTFVGEVGITGGTVVLANAAALGPAGQVVRLNGATLEFALDAPGNVYNLTGNSDFNSTIRVNRATGGPGVTQTLQLASLGQNAMLTVEKGANVTSGDAILEFGGINLSAGSTGTTTLNPTTAKISITGPVMSTSNNAKTLALGGTTTGNEISGVISNNSNVVSVTKIGTGTWTLSGANTYTGNTTVSEGLLRLTGAKTGSSGIITVGNTAGLNATLDITNGTYTIGGASTRINVGNQSTSPGTGTVNQSGGAIVFTTAGGDQLLVGQNTVGNTGIYNLSGGSITTATSAARGVILGVNSNPSPGPTSGGGTFNLSGTGALNMTAASGAGGDAILQIGRSDGAANNTTNLFNQTGGTASVGILAMGGAAAGATGVSSTLTLTGGTFSANSFTVLAAGDSNTAVINIGGTADVTLPAFPIAHGAGSTVTLNFDGGTLRPAAASATYISNLTNAYIQDGGAKFDVPAGRDITVTQALLEDPASTGGALTKVGPGVLSLSGANTYAGGTAINEGVLTYLNLGAKPASGTTSVAAGATLGLGVATSGSFFTTTDVDNFFTDNFTVANLLNVTAAATSNVGVDTTQGSIEYGTPVATTQHGLVKLGANTLTLTGTNAYGPTSILVGTLQIGNGGTAGTLGAGAVVNNAALVFNRTDTYTLAATNLVTGTGSVTLANSGMVAAAVDNQFAVSGNLIFGAAAGATTTGSLDLTAGSSAFGGLLVQTNSATANTITLGAGKTLTINGNMTVGYDAGSGPTGALPTKLTVNGGGTMSVTGTTITIGVNQAGAANQAFWNDATLDVTGLSAFNTNVTTFNIGVGGQTQGPGTVLLSNTANTILATTLTVGDTGGNNGKGPGTLQFGTGTNVVRADTINIGRGKSSGNGVVKFASQTAGSPGTVVIADKAGTGPAAITVGSNGATTGTAGGATGTLDLRGHLATVSAGVLSIGLNSQTSNSGGVTGNVYFDSGTFTADSIVMAAKTGANAGGATGNLTIGGGSFTVNPGGSFTLASQATAGSANGTLTLTGGTFTSNADIVDGGGTTTTKITLNGGTLDMTGKNIGSNTTPIDTVEFLSGTLKNVAEINGGGTLAKTGAGTLVLDGMNTYTGTTAVNEGTLLATKPSALPGYGAGLVTPVAANATLAVRAGGAGEWTPIEIAAVLAATGSPVGGADFNAGSKFGIEVFATNSVTYAGDIGANVAAKGFTKLGAGALTLSGANTYSGPTDVQAGTLLVNGSVTGAGNVTVISGATLGGAGSLAGAVAVNASGFIAPNGLASDTGTLNLGGTLTINGTAKFELGAAASDKIVVAGAADFNGGTLDVTALTVGGPTFTNGQVFDLFDYASYTNPFTTINLPLLTGGLQWKSFGAQQFDYTNGQIVVESTVVTPAIRTWDGGSSGPGDNLWSTAANWGTSGVPVNNTPKNELVFGGGTRLANNNDIASLSVGKLTFASGAGGFDLQGTALEIAGKIDNQATTAQKISLNVTFAAGTETATLNVQQAAGSLELAGAVNSTLGLTKTGLGTAKLSALTGSTYSGPTLVNEGTLEVTKGINLVADTDDTTVGTSTTTATLITEHIRQDTLTINAGSKVMISATGGAASTSVVNVLNIANASGSFSWSVPDGDISPAATGGPVASGAAVPEPATWLLAIMAALAGLVAWQRRR